MHTPHPVFPRRWPIRVTGLALLLLGGIALAGPGPSAAQPGPPPAAPDRHRSAPSPAHTRAHVGAHKPLQPAQITQAGWTNAYPRLTSVSAVGPNDVWALGEGGHLMHYATDTWSVMDPPVLLGADDNDITMFAAANGWIAAGARAFAWDGAAWTEHSAGLGGTAYLNVVGLSSATTAWGIANLASRDSIIQWNGSSWVAAGPVLTSTIYLTGLAFNATGEGWAGGLDGTTNPSHAVLLHYSGGSWTTVTVPPSVDAQEFTHLSSPAAGEVWMNGPDGADQQHIYSYRAGTWDSQPVPSNPDIKDIHMESATSGWLATLYGVYDWNGSVWQERYAGAYWGVTSAAGQAWAVGAADTIATNVGAVLNTWTKQRQGPTQRSLYGVGVVSPHEAWAVGDNGTIMHYTGGTWVPVASNTTQSLNRIQVLDANDIYAVGYQVILHWDGSAWSTVYTPGQNVAALAMTGPGTGWAVGQGGWIWRCTGGTWAPFTSPTASNLWTVALDSPNHGWAAGSEGVLLEWNGTSWLQRTGMVPANFDPFDMELALAGSEGWLVGNNPGGSTAIHLVNGTWTADSSQTDFLGAVGIDLLGTTAWITGADGRTQRGTQGNWQQIAVPARQTQWDMAFAGDGTAWIVGDFGEIDHYLPPAPACNTGFTDVQPTDYFAVPVQYLACSASSAAMPTAPSGPITTPPVRRW
jgi:hypothetical protein